MGLLAPLYALAALAVVGPIVFHLIRRQPQGQMLFSSLMFLSPSPPRLTRRSRLDNLFLLLLRVLAIVLIALAFARPYLRQESLLSSTLSGRRIVALVDTSGSMQRGDVWAAAQAELSQLLDSLSPDDRVALYTIDETLNSIVSIDEQEITDPLMSRETVRGAIAELEPSWRPTRLAEGLKAAADVINSAAIAGTIDPTAVNELVLITDLHGESGLEALQGYPWPDTIRLDVRQVRPALPGNARASLMYGDEDGEVNSPVRVRVENNADSTESQLQLTWANANGPLDGNMAKFQVPPGQVRVVPLDSPPSGSDRILLSGDTWDGDNTVFVVEPAPTLERIAVVATDSKQPEDSLGYFVERAPLSSEMVRREVVQITPDKIPALLTEPQTTAMIVETSDVRVAQAEELRRFAEAGGTVIACMARPLESQAAGEMQARVLEALFELDGLSVTEAETGDFALLSLIDFGHPVFAPFSDPRFNDFGKIRFWSHRVVDLPSSDEQAEMTSPKVVAAFDDDSPLLVEQRLGQGRLWLLTGGWQPTAGGLGLSSKFVPILLGLLDPEGRTQAGQLTYEVGQAIDVSDMGDVRVLDEENQPLNASLVEQAAGVLKVLAPGLLWLEGDNGLRRQIAVQVPATESRLVPLDNDVFEQYDVPLGKVASDRDRREQVRQMKIEELEQKQRLWQWLIVGCLAVLGLETLVAGWLTK